MAQRRWRSSSSRPGATLLGQDQPESLATSKNGGNNASNRKMLATADFTDKKNPISAGIDAMRAVRKAARVRDAAEKHKTEVAAELERRQNELERRLHVTENHDAIVRDQSQELALATKALNAAEKSYQEQEQTRDAMTRHLDETKEENEQALAPYKNLSDTARERLDDAARALSAARRAVKAAENAYSEVKTRTNERTSVAQQTIKNSEARIERLVAQSKLMKEDPDSDAQAKADVARELKAEQARLVKAKQDASAAEREGERATEDAKRTLESQREALTQAEVTHKQAKEAAETRKHDFEERFRAAQAKEHELDEQLRTHVAAMRDTNDQINASRRRAEAAQASLDEAREVAETPEKTQELREMVAELSQELSASKLAVEQAKRAESRLRSRTKGARRALIGIIVACVLVVVLVVVWLAGLTPLASPLR